MAKALTIRNQDICAELLLMVMCCFAPWPYGSVDAGAEYVLYGGLFAIIGLRLIADWRAGERSLGSGPLYWALLGIVAIALLQAVPLSEQVIQSISPGTISTRSSILPQVMETVRGDTGAPVAATASTISLDRSETWHGLVRLAAIFLLFDCASRSRLRYSMLDWFAKLLVVNSTLLAMFALAQALTWNGKIFWMRETNFSYASWGGPFFCHNHLAANLNIGLGLSLGLLFMNLDRGRSRDKGKLGRFFLLYTTGLITVGILASQSRGGVIAMVVSLLLVVAMVRIRPSRILPALAGILLLSIIFLMSMGPSSSIARLGTISESLTTGLNGRAEVWESALMTWRSYPVLGTGFGTYAETTSPNYNPVEYLFFGKFAAHGESEYAEMLVEGGLVGLGLLFVVVFDLLRKTLIAVKQAPKGMQALVLGGLFGIATITTQSLADFPLHVAGVTVPAVVLASKLYRLGSCKEDRKSEPEEVEGFFLKVRRAVVTLKNIALLATAGVLISYQASQVKLEHLIDQARLPLPGSQWVTAEIPHYSRSVLETMQIALTEALKIRPDWAEGHMRLGQVQLGLYRHAAAEALEITLQTVDPDIRAEGNSLESEVETETPSSPEPEPEPLPQEGTIDPATGRLFEPGTGGQAPGQAASPLDTSAATSSTPEQNTGGSSFFSKGSSPNSIKTPFGTFTLPIGTTTATPKEPITPPGTTPPLGTPDPSGTSPSYVGSIPLFGSAKPPESKASPTTGEAASSEESAEPVTDETPAEVLWLHKVMHQIKDKNPEQVEQVIEHDPVRNFLVPAARSFLEARRCCPLLAVPQIQLASLDYLIKGEETSLDYVKRAIKLKGNHPRMLLVGAQVAVDLKELDLAMEYWREYLRQRPLDWAAIAVNAVDALKPEQVLEVAKGGGVKTLVPIGLRVYTSTLEVIYRVRFMEAALAALPTDTKLDDEERIWYEGRIRGELAQYDTARGLMRKAIDLQPLNEDWRLEYVELLITWGCYDEAYRLALMGSRYHPRNGRYQRLMQWSLSMALESGWTSKQLSAGNQTFDR